MSQVILLAGSPSPRSRSTALLGFVGEWLAGWRIDADTISVRDFPAQELLYAERRSPALRHFNERIEQARAVVIATPIYKASISGALKTLLDVMPENALAGRAVLPLATGGTASHLLAVEYSFKPVLAALGARHILGGVYATDDDLVWERDAALSIAAPVQNRLEASCEHLLAALDPSHSGRHGSARDTAGQTRAPVLPLHAAVSG